jgi:ubiquinone/menaquinone biosynthesis C-methylase UbiE
MDLFNPDLLFRSLSDSVRRQIARILAETALTVGEIAGVLGLPQSTVSRHLKTLRSTGLLVDRSEGNRVFIELVEPSGGGKGEGELSAVLNSWIRHQALPSAVHLRLRQMVESRDGSGDTFEKVAHQWDELRSEHFGGLFHLEAVASLLPTDWRVLDIGTGTGYMLPFLARQFARVIAADASSAMLELARQRVEREGLSNVQFKLGRIEDLPVEDASIDCALAILVLRHSPDIGRSVEELARAIVNGGRLLVVDVAPHSMEDFRRRIGDVSNGLDPDDVVAELEGSDFSILSCRLLPMPGAGSPAAPTRPAPDLFLVSAERRTREAQI